MSGFVGFDKYIRSYNLYGVFKISIFHFQRAVPPHVLAALMGHANGSFSWPAFAPLQLSSSCHSDETIIIISPWIWLEFSWFMMWAPSHPLLAFGQLL